MPKTLTANNLIFNLEAERSVIGGLILDPEKYHSISEKLVSDDFYRQDHKIIFQAISDLNARRESPDVIILSEHLERIEQSEKTGGLAYLGDIVKNTPSVSNISSYANIVSERSQRRKIIATLNECLTVAGELDKTPMELISSINSKIINLSMQSEQDSGFKDTKQLMGQALDKIQEYVDAKGELPGLSTGFSDLDNLTLGLQASDLVVLAGRPSMGKTALGMNLCSNIARNKPAPVFIFSLEMTDTSLMLREFASLAGIDFKKIKKGLLDDQDWTGLTNALEQLKQHSNLFVSDKPNQTVEEVIHQTRKAALSKGKPQLIMLDYLQFMGYSGKKDREDQEIQHITRQLKALAKEMSCPVLLLSQLNRGLETRIDKRPVMADLKGSGAIEQDADVIMFIYRDEVYHQDTNAKGIAEIIVGKQRDGELGTVYLRFMGHKMRFSDANFNKQF